jgi:pimeloyl-ACP methyl ester carboxylesterase
MMNGRRPFFNRLCKSVDLPVLGPLLYKLNVNRIVVRFMAAGHVYADPWWLSGDRLREKLTVTRARGARFASIRFVTGALDPVETSEQFLALARQATIPMLTVYGDQTPPRSRAEMEALAKVDGIQSIRLPRGKLSPHEEFAAEVAEVVAPFLSGVHSAGPAGTSLSQDDATSGVSEGTQSNGTSSLRRCVRTQS